MNNTEIPVLIRAVLIDDDPHYAQELDGLARECDIHLTHFPNLEKAKEELPDMRQVDFIILDAYCFVDEQDTSVDTGFVSEAKLVIEKLGTARGRAIPYCINTGFIHDDKLKRFKRELRVFEKSKDHHKLFAFIQQTVTNDEAFQIKERNKAFFELFELGLLNQQYEPELIALFKEVAPEHIVNKLEPLKRMRPILEAVLVHLNKLDRHLISPAYFKAGVNVSGIIRYLAGNPKYNQVTREQEFHADRVLPEHVYYSISASYSILSCALHHYEGELTPHIVKSCFYSLLEFLSWYKRFVLKHYKLTSHSLS